MSSLTARFTADTTINPDSVALGIDALTLADGFALLVADGFATVCSGDTIDRIDALARNGLDFLAQGRNLTIGQTIALWGLLRTDQIAAQHDADIDALLATDLVGPEYVAAKRRVDARRNRAFRVLNGATGRDWRKDGR